MFQFDWRFFPVFDVVDPATAYPGEYGLGLIVTSVSIAILAAAVALAISDRIIAAGTHHARFAWACAGAASMGGGIWAMHFIGMLAFSLPCGIDYDPVGTILSMIPGVLASGVALAVISQRLEPTLSRLVAGATLMGAGIGAMHYSGMAAMRPDALLRYDPMLVAVSVVVAVALAFVSLSIRFRFRFHRPKSTGVLPILIPASIMGVAVSGMHYTAMEASLFFPISGSPTTGMALGPATMAVLITVFTVLIAACTLVAVFAGRQSELALNLSGEITRRALVEQEAKNGRARLQAILDAVADAIVTIDQNGRIQQWSLGAERMFGYAADEVAGADVTMLMPTAHQRHHHGYVNAFLTTREAKIIGTGRELTAIRKDGTEFPIDLTVSEVQADQETLFTGIMRDITERKRAEADLVNAREEADAASRAKSLFLANMSHEIRTPLNSIIGLAHLVLKNPLPPRERDYIRKIQQSGRHLLGIINDILDFSKIEADQLTVEAIEFDLEDVLSNLSDLVAEKAQAKGLELIFDVAAGLDARLVGDPLRLGQILINFVNNAIKFTPAGEVGVTVRRVGETDRTVTLRMEVRDTGIGLSTEQSARLFESFQQADTSTTRKYGGTGLGLAICRRLARLMGGEVGVASELGHGSVFWLEVPLGKGSMIVRSNRRVPVLDGRRALVVDDNANARTVLVDMLLSMRLDVSSAPSGKQALEVVAREEAPFDIVFLDWRMPNLDGVETGRRIRAIAGPNAPALVLVTAFGHDEILRVVESERFEGILLKPVSPSTLFDTTVRLFGGDVSADPSPGDLPATTATFKPARVLLVEDNELNQDVARDLLTDAGLQVDIVGNGQAALDHLVTHVCDLVIMDMQMPVMDGLTATKHIRANRELSDMPIIAMTANASSEDRRACFEAGMDDYVTKPIEPTQLYSVLARWLPGQLSPPTAPTEMEEPRRPIFWRIEALIDVAGGMRRASGRLDSYLAMLGRFAGGFEDAPLRIEAALSVGDLISAEREAHSTRGVAGNIGAKAIESAAARLEAAIRAGVDQADVTARVRELATSTAAAIAAIRDLLQEQAAEQASAARSSPRPLDADAQERLARLQRLLAEDDPDARHAFAEAIDIIRDVAGPQFNAIESAVVSFNFEAAKRALDAAMSTAETRS